MPLFEEQTIFLNNSLTGKKEKFTPLSSPNVGMYVCGPTVYSDVHLGNCRTFISFDMIFRYLKHLGYNVRYVRNITDAGHLENDGDEGEDKIAKKARLEQIEPMEIVQRYTVDFHKIMNQFNTYPPSIEPTATGHIIEQIASEVLEKGLPNNTCLNVNIPKASDQPYKGVKVCRQAQANWEEEFDERKDPRGRNYYWLTGKFVNYDKGEDTDEWALANNYISVVPVTMDLTAHHVIPILNTLNFEVKQKN